MNTTIKAIALVAVIAMVAVAFSGDGSDGVGEQFTDGGLVYEVAGTSSVTVIGWEGASSEVVIPAEVEYNGRTLEVTRIGEEAFMGSSVTSVDFTQAANLTQIQTRAFYGLDIAEVVLPDSLTTLGADAFSCNDAVQSVEIPSRVTSYSHSFSRCSSLTEITVDSGNRNYSSDAGVLLNHDKDTIVQYPAGKTGTYSIPADVDTIGSYAFSGSQITRMEITSSVSTIGAGAFSYCDSLTQFTVSRDNRSFTANNGVLLNANSTQLVAYPAGKAGTEYSIPNRVTTISGSAFAGSSLQTVTFPTSVDEIGDYAFADSAITTLTLNSGLNDMGVGAFSGCVSLAEAMIPSSVTSMTESSFEGCISLKSVIWTATGSVSIGISAFEGCTALSTFEIPDRATTINDRAFYGCTSLSAVSIPDSVNTVGDQAFAASGLTQVTMPGCRTMGDGVFESCRSLGSVTIADDVSAIPEGTFSGCTSLDEIAFGEDPSLRTIGASAFAGTAFTGFSIPEGVTTVDATAFSGCSQLQTVVIPSTLRDMGERPFQGCDSLTSFTVSGDSTAYASVDGVLYSKDFRTLVRYPSAASSSEFSVPEGTVTISAGAFESADSLTTVEMPASVTTIGSEAFQRCSGLRSVAIASQELTVGDGAFDLSAGGDPVNVEIFTDAPEFPQSAFGEGTTVSYDEYKNYGLPDSDEIMGDALIWIVAAIVLGVIFLAVHIVVKRN